MREANLIRVTIDLLCEDAGLDDAKVGKGYVKNILKMHDREYKETSDGKVTERVTINRITDELVSGLIVRTY